MEKEIFCTYLKNYPTEYDFEVCADNGKSGVLVRNKTYQTLTFFSDLAISRHELSALVKQTHQGRNVDHITRVTGYFSKVAGWNKGKIAELADRARVTIETRDS